LIFRVPFLALALAFAPNALLASSATITVSRDASRASPSNTVNFSLHNVSNHDIYVVGYNSVLAKPEGRTTGNWLTITDSFGHEVNYVGRYVVNGPLDESSFLAVAPGKALEASVDLAREYDLPPAGLVNVSTTMAIFERMPTLLPDGNYEGPAAELVESNELTFPVIGGFVRDVGLSSVLQCTPDQLSDTKKAIAAAQVASNEAVNFLGSLYFHDPIDPANPVPPRIHMRPHRRYTNWFGVWDDGAPQDPDPAAPYTDNTRVDQTVTAVYARLMFGARTTCDECKGYNPLTRAWAEGTLIHLCPSNFGDPISGGITSQAGTIAHEVSHQNDQIAQGTVDLPGVHNRNDAHQLERPKAVRSAANYEYFITDTPLGR
jgi:hypothetical protein